MAFLCVATILVFALAGSYAKQQLIFVDSEAGVNNHTCICEGSSLPCKTLEYVSKKVNKERLNNIEIRIQKSPLTVLGVVWFQDISNVTLNGNGSWIKCGRGGAGFVFLSVCNLVLNSLTIRDCRTFENRSTQYRAAAVHILNSKHVNIHDVKITSMLDTKVSIALMLSNTYGKVTIQRSQFTNSGIREGHKQFYAGGVYVEFDQCHVNCSEYHMQNEYLFEKCHFMDNSGRIDKPGFGPRIPTDFIGFGLGGGLSLTFKGNSCCYGIVISDCKFARNSASWGGGLHVQFQDNSWNNQVEVTATDFTDNLAKNAGGGARIGYIASDYLPPLHNFVHFYNTRFIANDANYGGGTAIYASWSVNNASEDTVRFVNCTWEANSANIGAAVDVSPFSLDTHTQGFLIVPVFIDCSFTGNLVTQRQLLNGTTYTNTGSFVVTGFTVQFEGHIIFRDNVYSALEISSGVAKFQPGTNALFFNNSGIQGGAIAMYGLSSLHVQNNSIFQFEQNEATDLGAAIYHYAVDRHVFVSTTTHSCFIHYTGPPTLNVTERNLTFQFTGNTASKTGVSIYASSFQSCNYEWIRCQQESEVMNQFQCIGDFSFDEPAEHALATPAIKYYSESDVPRQEIPGKRFSVPLSVIDELGHVVFPVYRISIDNCNIVPNKNYTVKKTLALQGSPGENGTLVFHTVDFRELSYAIKVELQQCPPGYFFDNIAKTCECAAYNRESAYEGIYKCNNSVFQAYILMGFWAGYLPGKSVTPATLYTAHCPLGFCNYELRNCTSTKLQLLPGVASKDGLDNFMCGDYRTGLLCGKCKSGLTVYYHSRQYRCGDSKQCHLGLLFYVISELIPVTVLFIAVIVFDVSFTSGTANGFIFFSQVLDSLVVDANGVIQFPSAVDKLSVGYNIIYGLFNLDIFSIEQLSFCLWKQATVLDALAFKYVTVSFSFALVICLVLLMNFCHCRGVYMLKRKVGIRNSVIHGLSAFLVICYSQCTKVSFQILTLVILRGQGEQYGPKLTFMGGIPYFGEEHLRYAIPACMCLATIVILPPLLLLAYPLCLNVLALCGLSENKAILCTFRFIPITKLKPMLDSFQGCFKDRLRFFAGLYFLYRVAIIAAYAFNQNTTNFYFAVEMVVIIILGIHAVTQPYEKRKYNIFDSLIFVNLALVNGFTLFTITHHTLPEHSGTVTALLWLQMFLIYLPIVYICIYFVWKLVIMCAKKVKEEDSYLERENLYEDHPDHVIDHNLLPYQLLELHTHDTSPSDSQL